MEAATEMPALLKMAIDEKLSRVAACLPGTGGPSFRRSALREIEEIYLRTLPNAK